MAATRRKPSAAPVDLLSRPPFDWDTLAHDMTPADLLAESDRLASIAQAAARAAEYAAVRAVGGSHESAARRANAAVAAIRRTLGFTIPTDTIRF